jgi:hypothetical protein
MTGSDAMSEQSRLTATMTPTLQVEMDRPRRRLPVLREVRVARVGVPGMTEDDKENGRW